MGLGRKEASLRLIFLSNYGRKEASLRLIFPIKPGYMPLSSTPGYMPLSHTRVGVPLLHPGRCTFPHPGMYGHAPPGYVRPCTTRVCTSRRYHPGMYREIPPGYVQVYTTRVCTGLYHPGIYQPIHPGYTSPAGAPRSCTPLPSVRLRRSEGGPGLKPVIN